METTTAFDLNQTIENWRKNLGQSPALQRENLDELETHLRDSIARLQTCGLSESESFQIATQRLGATEQLNTEFSKANPVTIWRHRAVWMLTGMLFWTVGQDLIRIVQSMGVYTGSWITANGWALGWLGGILNLLAFACVFICFWRLANGRVSSLNGMATTISHRPALSIGLVIGFVLVAIIGATLFSALSFKRLEPMVNGQRIIVEGWFKGVLLLLGRAAIISGIVWFHLRQSKLFGRSQAIS